MFEFYSNTFPSLGQQEDSTDIDNVVALSEILHWQHGAHSFTFGGEGQYHQYSWVSKIGGTCSGNAGCLQFWPNQTASDEDFWGQDGNAFAAFLIGETGDATNLNDLHAPRWITHYAAVFGSDTWKAKPNLTMNIGLRWSYDTPRHEADGDTAIWDPTLPDAATLAGTYPAGAGRARLCRLRRGTQRKQERNLGLRLPQETSNLASASRGSRTPREQLSFAAAAASTTVRWSMPTMDREPCRDSRCREICSPPIRSMACRLTTASHALSTSPDLNPNQLDGTSTSADYVAKSNGRPGMVENWALETQYQIKPHLFATLGYLGMHATHLHAMLDFLNDMPDKDMALGDWLNWWAYYPPDAEGGFGVNSIEPYANFTCNAAPVAPGR